MMAKMREIVQKNQNMIWSVQLDSPNVHKTWTGFSVILATLNVTEWQIVLMVLTRLIAQIIMTIMMISQKVQTGLQLAQFSL